MRVGTTCTVGNHHRKPLRDAITATPRQHRGAITNDAQHFTRLPLAFADSAKRQQGTKLCRKL